MARSLTLELQTPRVVFGSGTVNNIATEVQRLRAERVSVVSTRSAARTAEQVVAQLSATTIDQIEGVAQHVPADLANGLINRARTSSLQSGVDPPSVSRRPSLSRQPSRSWRYRRPTRVVK